MTDITSNQPKAQPDQQPGYRQLLMKESIHLLNHPIIVLLLIGLSSGLVQGQSPRDSILYQADRSAQFPGGISALYSFIHNSLHYPDSPTAEQGRQKVGIQITITRTGMITDVVTPPNLQADFGAEIRRLIERMPRWLPASRNDQLVESTVMFYVNFVPPNR